MTRTKTNKLVAILMAVLMAFAFLSYSLTYVSAADNNEPATAAADTATGDNSEKAQTNDQETPNTDANSDTDKKSEETDNKSQETDNKQQEQAVKEDTPAPATETAPRPSFSYDINNRYGAPDVEVIIDFGNTTPYYDYAAAAKNPNSTNTDIRNAITAIMNNIKVYKNYNEYAADDKKFTNEVTVSPVKFKNLKFEKNILTFTIPLKTSTNLSSYTDFYLWLGPELNRTKNVQGFVTFEKLKTGVVTTTAKKTTYRTVSTTRTVKAKSANTGDNSNLPVWIGLAAVAGLMLSAVYFTKEKE